MKTMLCLLAGVLLFSGFTVRDEDNIDGIWLGYYRTENTKAKMVIKFNSEDRLEFYAGGMNEEAKCDGYYRQLGDSISFKYRMADGREYVMQGELSRRGYYLEGTWKTEGIRGSFYLEKQDVVEKVVKLDLGLPGGFLADAAMAAWLC